MTLVAEYRAARLDEEVPRLRRALVLRAMSASGLSQRENGECTGGPILRRVAELRGFTKLAVFGSVARGQARQNSDIDLLVQAPPRTTISDLLALRALFEDILGRGVDLITYGGLDPMIDDDIRREAVPV